MFSTPSLSAVREYGLDATDVSTDDALLQSNGRRHSSKLPRSFSDPQGSSVSARFDNRTKTSLNRHHLLSSLAQLVHIQHNKKQRRLVLKNGNTNVTSANVTSRRRGYVVDLFTTLVDLAWRYILLLFTLAFVVSWILFALLWWLVAAAHSDDDTHSEPPCVDNVHNLITALLFSVETQHTIGYGARVIQTTCPGSIVLFMVQSCVGVLITSIMAGTLFAKLTRPKCRAQTLLFSRSAVICKRDGVYCLLFRVGDMRRSHIINTSVRAVLVKTRHTAEGETIPLCQHSLDLETETTSGCADSFVFLVWPITVVHRITSASPLWNLSAETLINDTLEIIVLLHGVIESTGRTVQARTSYVPEEIRWGHRLCPLMTFCKQDGQYQIDFSEFHSTVPMVMPEVSACEHAERKSRDEAAERSRKTSVDASQFSMTFSWRPLRHNNSTRRARHSERVRTDSFKRTISEQPNYNI